MAIEVDYIELGLACADGCRALRGLYRRGAHDGPDWDEITSKVTEMLAK